MKVQLGISSLTRLFYQVVSSSSTVKLEVMMINIENYYKNIPQELKELKQWLWFKIYYNEDKNGKFKAVKIPISPITYKSNEWNKSENQVDFDTALSGIKNSDCDGLSFVLTDNDPYICIDVDKLSDLESEKIANVLNDFNATYKEMSVSKNGLHIFAKGNISKSINNQNEHIEMYKSNKCIAMKGNSIDEQKEIVDMSEMIKKYYDKYAPREIERTKPFQYKAFNDEIPDAKEILKNIYKFNAKGRALFRGEYSTGDASKDDFQLLLILNSFTHGDGKLMLDLFLHSALNRMVDKSKRKTESAYIKYLNQSIRKAQIVGGTNYWNYNYHKNIGGRIIE